MNFLRRLLIGCAAFYLLCCVGMYFFQELLLFRPTKLSKEHIFQSEVPFDEKYIPTKKGGILHGLLFHADHAQGVILYLHGNGGSVKGWANVAPTYTNLGYDVFMIDYPGFGKSEGTIASEEQLIASGQAAYDFVRTSYEESDIVILGYSIGTGIAAHLASNNHARMLILQAPYLSMKDLARRKFPWVPSFVLRYPLMTDERVRSCNMPVVIFHGDNDNTVPYESSLGLMKELRSKGTLITLHGWGHNNFTDCPEYLEAIRNVLK